MDGAYVPDDNIIEDSECTGCVYSDTEIRTDSVDRIKKRNIQKRETLFRLTRTDTVRSIPYHIYYMSCDLDHVLYNKRNSSDIEKEQDAYAFASKYKGDVSGFLNFICDSDFAVSGDYKDSWNFIEKDLHSLERHSNLCICLNEERERLRSPDFPT